MEREPSGTLITLCDEDGAQHEFECLASIEYDGTKYVALNPSNPTPEQIVDNDGLLIIMKAAEDKNGENIFMSVSEDEYRKVAPQFEKGLEDEYDFEDDD